MDCAFDGGQWWRVLLLDGSSRTSLAGAVAPVEARGVTLMVLYPASLRYGARQALIADSAGAYTSQDVRAVFQRFAITPTPIVRTPGESSRPLLETHGNMQRRFYDYPCAQTTPPAAFEQLPQPLMTTYHTTAPHG